MLVAGEALRERETLARRWPALVAFLFGLVHGLGFAGALKEIGLPQKHLALALLTFNVGVEIGQLMTVLAPSPRARADRRSAGSSRRGAGAVRDRRGRGVLVVAAHRRDRILTNGVSQTPLRLRNRTTAASNSSPASTATVAGPPAGTDAETMLSWPPMTSWNPH